MKNYFYLQFKRVAKITPFVIILTLTLLIGLSTILYGALNIFANSDSNKRFSIAVTGDTDNEYLRLGMVAMQTFDETRFSVEFIELSEDDAKNALNKGDVSAYIIIPHDFVDKALSGYIEPITFVTSAGMEGVSGLLKKEITALITDMVVQSQRGVYGLYDAFEDNDLTNAGEHADRISVEYAELIFQRNKLYNTSVVGISDGLSTQEYYICAVLILLLVFIGLPFGMIYIKRDYTFNRLLVSRGYSTQRQIIFEYLAHLISMLLQTVMIVVTVFIIFKTMPSIGGAYSTNHIVSRLIVRIIPIIIMLSAFNIFMFEICSNIVSGLLLYFFTALSLCYISGCMYPIYAFPDVIKSISSFLPTNIARCYLATAFTYDSAVQNLFGLLFYSIVFFVLAWVIRYRKTVRIGGGRRA